MATPGLSLVGFMAQQQAVEHLRFACIPTPANASDSDLINIWNTAKARVVAPVPNAGNPQILDIPATHTVYATSFLQQAWIIASLQPFPGIQIKWIEIDPLLAYQFTVDRTRSAHNCSAVAANPTVDELFSVCLPTALPLLTFNTSQISPSSQSVIVKTPNHNVLSVVHGIFDFNMNGVPIKVGGMGFRESLPFVHVVRMNGVCFLHNGYHRVFGLRAAGATHVPCLLRDVGSYEDAGVKSDGTTFAPAMFQAGNSPTVGHFTQARAHDVTLRAFSRILHFSWAQHSMPDE